MKLTILALIRSFREANFTLYCEALSGLIPYFFANNNFNYARSWLSIHLRDMLILEKHHLEVANLVHKSCRNFPAMAIDQAHEQANTVIKGDGGVIGMTENPSALRNWTVTGPEVSHLVCEYEAASGAKYHDATVNTNHHEQTVQAQRGFLEKSGKLTRVLKDMGHPFQEELSDLLSLDTKDIAQPSIHELLSNTMREALQNFMNLWSD